jgi:pimeloyl-ACP methyl ester carboxylesterase
MKTLSRIGFGQYWLFGSLCLAIPATIYTSLFVEILPSLQAVMWALTTVWLFVALANIIPIFSNRFVGWLGLAFGGIFLVLDVDFIYTLSQIRALRPILAPIFVFLGLLVVYMAIGIFFGYRLSRRSENSRSTTIKLKKTLMVSLSLYLVVLLTFYGAFGVVLNASASQAKANNEAFIVNNQASHDAVDAQFNQFDRVVNGVNWHYVEAGNPNGTAILFLHGLPESWYTWRYVLPLMNQSYRLIAVDMQGYGRSITPGNNYDLKNIAKETVDLMDSLNITKFYVVGHDWGTLVGEVLVEQYPDSILGFVRMEGGTPINANLSPTIDNPQFLLFVSPRLGTMFMQDAQWFVNSVYLPRLVKPFSEVDKMYVTYEFSRPNVAQDVPLYFMLQNQQEYRDANNRLINQNWAFPILLLQADQDFSQPKSSFDGLDTIAPQLSLEWITNASHFDCFDQPEQVANAINRFIR